MTGFQPHLLLAHLPGDILRHSLNRTLAEFRQELVPGGLVGDGYGGAEVLTHVGRHLLHGVRLHRTGNEYARLTVVVIHREFNRNDIARLFHLRDSDVQTLPLYSAITRDERVARQLVSSDTHRLKQPQPHTLAAYDGLVAMHAHTDCVSIL